MIEGWVPHSTSVFTAHFAVPTGNSEGVGSIFKGKYEAQLEIPEGLGGGVKPSAMGDIIFSGTAH